ncbi:hypothetical protein [Arthrobacter zhaoguopingii]|uniref:hypothetical protein n=1 Tax=Arthrobacter zhaoguopingii TaxID=2681491 RepID=UPI001356E510|nr:hypothetical protein [Arthrobacter zhaoguopingii]
MNKNLKLAGAGVLSLVLLGGGAGIGSAITDPTKSEEYAAMESENRSKQSKVDDLTTGLTAAQKKNEELEGDLRAAEDREDELAIAEAAVKKREDEATAAEAAVKKREDAVKGAETAKAASSITDGSWTVGRTVEAGTYTTERAITGSCYWEITTSGTNGDDIIANDNVSGGQPTITLAEGQDFKSKRCGTWVKLG